MNDRMKTMALKQFNHNYSIILTYDKCKKGESQYGPCNLYGVEHNGEQQGIFADEHLHNELKNFRKGTRLIIRGNQNDDVELSWLVTPANGESQNKSKQTIRKYS